jgi:esterase/lipase
MAAETLNTTIDYSQKTLVVGLSFGATVAMTLDGMSGVPALVLLAPAVVPRLGLKGHFYALARRFTPTLFSRLAGWNGEIVKAMEEARNSTKEIETPTLVLQARDDRVLSTKGLKILRRRLTHADSEVVLLPFGTHALTRGKAKEEVFERVYKFALNQKLVSPED